MKIKYNVLSIYNDTNESIVISKQFDTYDDVLESDEEQRSKWSFYI